MSKFGMPVPLLVAAVLACSQTDRIWAGPRSEPQAREGEVAQLREQVKELHETVARLESALEELQARPPTPAVPLEATGASPAGDPLAAAEKEVAVLEAAQPARANPRTAFNPELSVIGDFAISRSSIDDDPGKRDADGLLIGDGKRDRASVRELELALQAPIDPFARADAFLAFPGVMSHFHDSVAEASGQEVELEEAYLTYWRLPWNLQLKVGKFLADFGKNNTQHCHAMEAADRPWAIQHFLGHHGFAETGVGLQTTFNLDEDFSTQLHVSGQIFNGEGGEGEHSLFAGTGSDDPLYAGRLRLYHELSKDTNLDLGVSMLNGWWDPYGALRQRIEGLDVTYRWEPEDRLGYEKLLLRGEYLRGRRDQVGAPALEADGWYAMAQYTFDKLWDVGVRYDDSEPMPHFAADPLLKGQHLDGYAAWLTCWTTEFNRLRLQYNHTDSNFPRDGKNQEDALTLQWTWSLGPHGAHPY
ncbi:MAG: hypothetical protein HY814_01970 [Candidatus Riflebacteria bacterium]|nr:hypothetical protein [Candidatus Riflebacteria bacterium]